VPNEPSQFRSVLLESVQLRGSISRQDREAEMSYAESARADYASESSVHLARHLDIDLRDWAGDLPIAPILRLVAVLRLARRKTDGRGVAVCVAAFERN
jgi:hypothetical protein